MCVEGGGGVISETAHCSLDYQIGLDILSSCYRVKKYIAQQLCPKKHFIASCPCHTCNKIGLLKTFRHFWVHIEYLGTF